MADRNTSGLKAIPRLVVKIIGGKQVKQFITGPEGEGPEGEGPEGEGPEGGSRPDCVNESPAKQDLIMSKSPRQMEDGVVGPALQAALHQAPNRLCVTAPSGDRSLSYIHQRVYLRTESTTADVLDLEAAVQEAPPGEEDQDWFSSVVRGELAGWQPAVLRSLEEELSALDPTQRGTANQSEITYVFLKNEVPLKLSTFYLLLQMFCDEDYPDQIHYRELLHFINTALFPEDHHRDSEEAASRCMSQASVQASRPTASGGTAPSVALEGRAASDEGPGGGREPWLQRFQRLERALHLSDTQKTGYMDKDKTKKLIQNYNQILNLGLSEMKISEATRGTRTQRQVDLDTALQHLKEL